MKNLIAILLFVFLAQPSKIDSARLLDDDRTLASDSFEGREAATPGGKKAQEYIISRFREIQAGHHGQHR